MFIGTGVNLSSIYGGGASFLPSDLPDLALWLDAYDASTITEVDGAVSVWADKSGNGNDALQGNVADRPVYLTTGFGGSVQPYMSFSGDELEITDSATLDLSSGFTLFAVVVNNGAGGATDNRIFNQWDAGQLALFTSFNNDTEVITIGFSDGVSNTFRFVDQLTRGFISVVEIAHDGASADILLNGEEQFTGVNRAVQNSTSAFRLGSVTPASDSVSIAEILLYTRELSNSERSRIQSYLFGQWRADGLFPPLFSEGILQPSGVLKGTTILPSSGDNLFLNGILTNLGILQTDTILPGGD